MHQMPYKPSFMKYKYLRLANRQLASDWRYLWMWGMAAPDSWHGVRMTLLGVEGEAVSCDSPGWARPGPAHSWEVLSPGG